MPTSYTPNFKLVYLCVFYHTHMGVLPHTRASSHFAPVLNLASFRPQIEALQACDALRMERKIDGQSIHAFKLPKRSVINKICALNLRVGALPHSNLMVGSSVIAGLPQWPGYPGFLDSLVLSWWMEAASNTVVSDHNDLGVGTRDAAPRGPRLILAPIRALRKLSCFFSFS